MSMAKRDSQFANAGMVVAIEPDDLQEMAMFGELRCLRFQQATERALFKVGTGTQAAPATCNYTQTPTRTRSIVTA